MAAVPTYTKTGTKATSAAKLNPAIFGLTVDNHELLKQAYVAYLSNGRINLAVTKTRGLVRGGGRKPWKQKGTGRARFGSSRNPIWRGGGIVFGPTGQENYTKKLNTKSTHQALRQALSLAAQGDQVIVLEDFTKTNKTNELAKFLNKIKATGRVLLISELSDDLSRASHNLNQVILVRPGQVNVFDVMNSDYIVISKPAIQSLEQRLGGKA